MAEKNLPTKFQGDISTREGEIPAKADTTTDWSGGLNQTESCGIGINSGDIAAPIYEGSSWSADERNPQFGQAVGQAPVSSITYESGTAATFRSSFVQAAQDTPPDGELVSGVLNKTGQTVKAGEWAWGVKTTEGGDFIGLGADSDGQLQGLVRGAGGFQFARATGATSTTYEGQVVDVQPNELRFDLARRVENRLRWSEDFSQDEWRKSGGASVTGTNIANLPVENSQVFQRVNTDVSIGGVWSGTFVLAGEGTTTLAIYSSAGGGTIEQTFQQVTLTATPRRYAVQHTFTQNKTEVLLYLWRRGGTGDTAEQVYVNEALLEDVTGQGNQNPGEYVSVDVLGGNYHGLNVDGVAQFSYQNGNTVDGSGVVTAAKGADLTTDWGAYFEPYATTNYSDTDNDLSGGSETVDLTSGGTGDYTFSVKKGDAAVTVAAGTATGTGFAQATLGNPVTFNLTAAGTVTLTKDSGTLGTSKGGAHLKQLEKRNTETSFVPASGGNVTRTADDASPMYDISNWSQTEGTWYASVWISTVGTGLSGRTTVVNSGPYTQGQIYVNENYLATTDTASSSTLNGLVDYSNNLNEQLIMALDFKLKMEIGSKNVTQSGAFVWDASPADYSGTYNIESNGINVARQASGPVKIRGVTGYITRKGKDWVDNNV